MTMYAFKYDPVQDPLIEEHARKMGIDTKEVERKNRNELILIFAIVFIGIPIGAVLCLLISCL